MKKCNKCNSIKPETLFYKGQGECKECTKKRVREREQVLRQNPEWCEKEKKRARDKYYRLGYKDKYKQPADKRKKTIDVHKEKYPEKYRAKVNSGHVKVETKGNHKHHWSYNKDHYKDVIELTLKDHFKIHRFIIYDQERMMYRVAKTGELLDSRQRHLDFINPILGKCQKHRP